MIISKIRMKSACKLSDWGFLQPTKSFPVRTDKLPTGAGGLSASTTLYFVNLFFKVHPPIGLEKFRVLSPRQPMFADFFLSSFYVFVFQFFKVDLGCGGLVVVIEKFPVSSMFASHFANRVWHHHHHYCLHHRRRRHHHHHHHHHHLH